MPEDIDFGKLYEGLDQIPGLIENAKRQDLRDKANAEKFKEIKDDVSGMKTEITSLICLVILYTSHSWVHSYVFSLLAN